MTSEATPRRELLRRANMHHPSPEDRAALRENLKARPPATWRIGIALLAEDSSLDVLGNGVVEETTRVAADLLRKKLGAESSSTLEQLAIDHIVLCWIIYHNIDFAYTTKTSEPLTLAAADFWDRHLASAQQRYLRSLETLARLRRMRLPAVQLNIAAVQQNIAT